MRAKKESVYVLLLVINPPELAFVFLKCYHSWKQYVEKDYLLFGCRVFGVGMIVHPFRKLFKWENRNDRMAAIYARIYALSFIGSIRLKLLLGYICSLFSLSMQAYPNQMVQV